MDKLGVALIGAGGRMTSFLAHIRRTAGQCRLVGLTDLIPAKAKLLLDHYGSKARLFASMEEAIADPAVGAVVICTNDAAHAEPTIKALRAGKHVYCEKPMATTLEDCDAIMEAAQASKAILYVGFNLRHSPVYETVRRLLDQAKVGKIITIEASEWYYGGRTYFRRWNRLRYAGGGLWITKACHDFDLLNWFSGGQPTRVYAVGNLSYYRPKPEGAQRCRDCTIRHQCPDFVDVLCNDVGVGTRLALVSEQHGGIPADACLYNSDKDTFDNGIAVVEYDNDVRSTHTVNVVASRTTRRLAISGDRGLIEADLERNEVVCTERHTNRVCRYDLAAMTTGGHGGSDERIWQDFLRSCQTGQPPRSSWAEGRLSVQVGLAARRSMDTGVPVPIE